MRENFFDKHRKPLGTSLLVVSVLFMALAGWVNAANLPGLTVSVNGSGASVPAYRWLVEQDKTYHVQTEADGTALPTVFDPNWDQGNDNHVGGETLSVGFHQSYMPVVGKGCVGFDDVGCNEVTPVFEPNTHYFVSVVPRIGATIGGASFKTDASGNVPPTDVFVNEFPLETAQITILVYHDNAPINNAPDLPTEEPGTALGQTDMSGFTIVVEDAGGRYGASAGVMSQDAFGNPLCGGECITGPDGRLTIKNLAPGKYGISVIPPAGKNWQQTATIEGTKVIDAWVKSGEPPFFAEFGPPGYHVTVGFIQPFNGIPTGGTATLSGTVVNQHMSRPPDYAFYNGGCFGHTTPWVGLNDMAVGIGTGIYAAPTDENCNFTIPNVPDGNYQLVFWDNNLDLIFASHGVSIKNGECLTPNGSCNVGEVAAFQWFHRQEHRVFYDANGNGLWDAGEGPSQLETGFNLRWRDGTINQSNVSDGAGAFTFDQVFPFFSWLVAEVDFIRDKATGLTVVVDNGGAIGPANGEPPLDGLDWTFGRAINPQNQLNPADPACADGVVCEETDIYRVERGPVLTQGFQGFIGQTSAFLWGKQHYPDGENGGITGIVFYAVTRAENDPRYAAAEVWEPGIPGVPVNLYNSDGTVLLNTTTTDSWDASIPVDCKYGNDGAGPFMFSPDGNTFYEQDCWDGLRMFNQARPAVFDGGYAFDAICADGMTLDTNGNPFTDVDGNVLCSDGGSYPTGPMPVGDYVVQVVPPLGYEIIKPEDKNVDFGDQYNPAPNLLPAECVGEQHIIPAYLSLFPDEMVPAPFAGTSRPLCDAKLVTLSAGANAATDFFLFTEVPVAAHGLGFILDDTQNEFDPNSPNFGEKYAPPFVPITIRDFTGRVISKTLSDQYGLYNFLAPSTITANRPAPSGMSPNMLTACMNDPGDDPNNPDPNWNQLYSTFCYTLQYMPGVTTYLDTPVVPVGAFTGPDQFPLDCEYPDGTPRIYSVSVNGSGPYIPTIGNNNNIRVNGNQTITITSMGQQQVQNPEYCNPAAGVCPAGSDTTYKFITRDYGFGASGTVTLGNLGALNCTWGEPITCTIPANTPVAGIGGRQLTVTRANGGETVAGVTVQVGLRQNAAVSLVSTGGSIQQAINSAGDNDLILVAPGQYNEMVVMWKPVQLQGWGEGSTTINAIKAPADKLDVWRTLVDSLIAGGFVDLLPGQEIGPGVPEPTTLFNEEGAGVLVLARDQNAGAGFARARNRGARIDGFTIRSADTGGGIIANGYANYLQISNNRLANNSGVYGGGIRIGHPLLTHEETQGNGNNQVNVIAYTDAENDYVAIHHNQVVFNGGLDGAGGGISMCNGSDSYAVTENWVCGNFTAGNGGGIGHIGMSVAVPRQGNTPAGNIPLIGDNTVIFNENFLQGQTVSGGGLYIGGAPPLTPGAQSPGVGRVQVRHNLIQGNSAGAGNGGGVRVANVSGPSSSVALTDNTIVNNVAGLAGGGISVQNGANVSINSNTIANNDSLATAGDAFSPGSPNQSTPQPGAGIALENAGGLGGFNNNIVWQNRQFYFWVDASSGCVPGDPGCTSTYGLCPDPTGALTCTGAPAYPVYNDLAGTGAGTGNVLTGDPNTSFVAEYFNGSRSAVFQNEVTTGIQVPAAFDEGGNFIRPSFGPLSLYDDPVSPNGDPGTLFGDYRLLP